MLSRVFHYAPWAKLPAIVASRCLMPSNAGAPGELPLLWFSANQHWEPTATKMLLLSDGTRRSMSFQEQKIQFGCVRFGLSAHDTRLMNWKASCVVASIGRDERRALERSGKKRGADPAHWFAVVDPLPVSELILEVFGDEAWHFADAEEMAQVWKTQRGQQP